MFSNRSVSKLHYTLDSEPLKLNINRKNLMTQCGIDITKEQQCLQVKINVLLHFRADILVYVKQRILLSQ